MNITAISVIKKLLILFLIFSGLYFAKGFLMPIAIGGVIATLFLPYCGWMEKKKIPKSVAAFICLLVILIIISLIGFLLFWQISSFMQDFVIIKQKAFEKGVYIQEYIFNHLGIAVEKQSQILKTEQPSVTSMVKLVFGSLRDLFVNIVLILAYVFMLLYYRNHIKQFLIKVTPIDERKEMEQIAYNSTHVAQQYLLGLAKMIALLWVMYSIGFGIIGVHNFIFFAVVCGILEIIPFIGNITGTVLTVLVAAINGADLMLLFGIVITYAIVQFIQSWIFEPLIVGAQVKINPLFTILALLLGEIIWGIPGVIIAIPVTAMFKIICDHINALKPLGFLMGEIGIEKPGLTLSDKLTRFFR